MGERRTTTDTSDWYLIADHGDMVVRVSPGMLIGETSEGDLTLFDRSHAQFELKFAADGGLLLSAINEVELEVAGGARCLRAEVTPHGSAQIQLTHNVAQLTTDFADRRRTDDTVQIRAVPNASPNAEPITKPQAAPAADELSSHIAVPKRAGQPARSSTKQTEKPRVSPPTKGLSDPGRAPMRTDQQAQTAEIAHSHADRLTEALSRHRADKKLAAQPTQRARPSSRAGSEKPAAHIAASEPKPPAFTQPTRPQTADGAATGNVPPGPRPPSSQPAMDSQRPRAQTVNDHLAPAPAPTDTAAPTATTATTATTALQPNTKRPISPPTLYPSTPQEQRIVERLAGWRPQWILAHRAEILGAVVIGLAGVVLTLMYSTFRAGGAPEPAATIAVDQAPERLPTTMPSAVAESPGPMADASPSAPPTAPLPLSPAMRDTPIPTNTPPARREAPAEMPSERLPEPQVTTAPAREPVPQVATAPIVEPEPQITTAATIEPVVPAPLDRPTPGIEGNEDPAANEVAAASDEIVAPVPDSNFVAELEATGEALRAQAAQLARRADIVTAELAMQQGRLTSPPESSAYTLYSRVLAQDPDSPEAQRGLASVRSELINRAFAQLAGNQLDDARRSLAAAAESGANPMLIADLSAEVDYRLWLLDAGAGRFGTLYPAGRLVAVRQEPPTLPSSITSGSEFSLEVQFTVTKRGDVRDVDVLGNPPNNVARAVRRAVGDWRFEPAIYEGEPLAVRSSARVNFAD